MMGCRCTAGGIRGRRSLAVRVRKRQESEVA